MIESICHLSAQKAGVVFAGKEGKKLNFLHPVREASFSIFRKSVADIDIAAVVRQLSFLQIFIANDMIHTADIEFCPKCGQYFVDECPKQCKEQEFCSSCNDAHHDMHDKEEGFVDGDGLWYCYECKKDCPEYLAEEAEYNRDQMADERFESTRSEV